MDRKESIIDYSNKIVEFIKKYGEQTKTTIDTELLKDLSGLISEALEYDLKRSAVTSTSLVRFLTKSIELTQQKDPEDEHILKMKEIVDNNELLTAIAKDLQTNPVHCIEEISKHFPYFGMYFSRRMKFILENHNRECLYDSTGEKEIKEEASLLSHNEAEKSKSER